MKVADLSLSCDGALRILDLNADPILWSVFDVADYVGLAVQPQLLVGIGYYSFILYFPDEQGSTTVCFIRITFPLELMGCICYKQAYTNNSSSNIDLAIM